MTTPYRPKLYLETTVFNFYDYGKAQQKQRSTRALFDRIEAGEYEVYTSRYAVDELKRAHPDHYEEMYALIPKYGIMELPESEEANRLADIYIERGIIPAMYPDDARQIALATIKGLDCVVSYNMGHIVKSKTMIGTGLINKREGYAQIGLAIPKEIMDYDTTTA